MATINPTRPVNPIPQIYFTPTEGRIVAMLLARKEPVSAAAIAADLPRRRAMSQAVVAVMISNIRGKMARYGTPYRIEHVRRSGYLLTITR